MTAKEHLESLRQLNIQLDRKTKDLDDLSERATAIGSFDYSKDRVQTSPKADAAYAGIVERMAELEAEITHDADEFADKAAVARGYLSAVIGDISRDIVWSRFVKRSSWDAVARDTGVNVRSAQRRYSDSMKLLETTIYSLNHLK